MMHMYESDETLQKEDLNSLEHYGVKGQKWGLRKYQNPDGSYTELGKERRRVGYGKEESSKEDEKSSKGQNEAADVKIGGKAYKDMTRKELRAAKKRARHNEKERREKREFNRDKREAIENGDITFISKNISKFTNDEIDESIKRYKKMQDVWKLDKDSRKDADYYLDKTIKYLNKMDSLTKAATNIYNNFTDSANKANQKRKSGYEADQQYWKSIQEEWLATHPNANVNKNKDNKNKDDNNNSNNKNSVNNAKDAAKKEKEEYERMKREAKEEDRKEKEARREEKEDEAFQRRQEKADRKYEKKMEKMREKEERRQEKQARKEEKEAEKREREEEKRKEYYEDFASEMWEKTQKTKKRT